MERLLALLSYYVMSCQFMSCHVMFGFGYAMLFWLLFIDDSAAVSISGHAEYAYVTKNVLYPFLSYFCYGCDYYLIIMWEDPSS